MSKIEINGVGFGVTGNEDDYILLLDGSGESDIVHASKLVPEDGRAPWQHVTSLMDGFGEEHNVDVLAKYAETRPPRAYRLRIVVEAEPLTEAETETLLAAARVRERARRDESTDTVEGTCFHCHKSCNKADSYCYGCKAFVCEGCSGLEAPMGFAHRPEDHLPREGGS